MTVVEFYDTSPIENITGVLVATPNRVVYMGHDSPKRVSSVSAHSEKYFAMKHIMASCEYVRLKRFDTAGAVRAFESVIKTDKNCIFDISGGTETAIMALGVVSQRRSEIGLTTNIMCASPESGKVIICSKGFPFSVDPKKLCNSVEENAVLHGGAVINGGSVRPFLDGGLSCTIDSVWNCAIKGRGLRRNEKSFPRRWNTFVSQLLAYSERTSGGKGFFATDIKNKLKDGYREFMCWLWVLEKCGAVASVNDSGENISFECKGGAERLLGKAGNLLELKIYSTAKKCAGVFTDAASGVSLDWDGRVGDTENEIDVLLMKGLVPVFISCKNGKADDAELYKLNTVASKFGDKYARKILVASDFGGMQPNAVVSLKRRASDIGIRVVDNIHEISERELISMVKGF